MKRILLLWTLLATPLVAAETGYRIVHPDGTVEFTDQPTKGAQEIQIDPVPTFPAPQPQLPPSTPPRSSAQGNRAPTSTQQPSGAYETFTISSPREQETLWFNENGMMVSLQIRPALASGDEVVVRLDGEVAARGSGTSFTLKNVYRGPHTVSALITDEQGTVIREAKPVSFFMRQHSVLNPSSPLSPPSTTKP